MLSSMWSMSVVTLLVIDVRIGALKQETQPRRCHQCSPTNGTSCEEQTGWLSATCPGARPYCSTFVTGPDFSSWLGCAAAADSPCSLTNSPTQTLELTCICASHLCNAPFTNKLRNELLNFSSNNESGLTEAFFKLSNFANVSEIALYKAITVGVGPTAETSTRNITEVTSWSPTTSGSVGSSSGPDTLPRAEALKQQATAPSDDEEDEGEGSGADEDSRSRLQSPAAAAPAPPSSYLPANQNNAPHVTTPISFTPLLVAYILL